jgi:hypothetical protein
MLCTFAANGSNLEIGAFQKETKMTTETKIKALAKFLEVEADEISETTCDTFEHGRDEYRVLTDAEAHAATREYISDSVWAFSPSFLRAHTGIDEETIELMQAKCESANEVLTRLIKDFPHFVDDAVKADGRGHFLAGYDSEENEMRIDGETLYIYRVN